jgi:GcrA cell cycle regulator
MDIIKSPPSLPQHDELVIPLSQRKSINTLLPDDCRWPIGDPQASDFHFCGKRKVDGHPYCDVHMRRGFQPSRPRPVPYRPRDAA